MSTEHRSISIDGARRSLDLLLGGAPDGLPLVLHHGTPSDATIWVGWDGDCAARGLRLVAVSRPGYATSTRVAGRDVAHAAVDTAAVLGELGLGEFVTVGWSGGGPHALACAAVLGRRCRAVATLAGAAPAGLPELDFTAGMGPENVEEFGAALAGEAELRAWLAENGEGFRHVTGDDIVAAFGGLVPQVDKDVLVEGFAEEMAAGLRRALAGGFDGWLDDDLAFVRPWGVDLGSITSPVAVWQGDLDLMVPAAHGSWLAVHVPGAVARSAQGHGHISLVTTYRGQILDELLAASRAAT